MQTDDANCSQSQVVASAAAQEACSERAESSRDRFDLIDKEILASQIVAVMNAHWCCPDATQKKEILRRAERQIDDGFRVGPPTSGATQIRGRTSAHYRQRRTRR